MTRPSTRLKHAWNAFNDTTEKERAYRYSDYGSLYSTRPDRVRLTVYNERTIVSSIYTRLAIDVAGIDIRHVRLDDRKRYSEDVESGLNDCLTLQANVDQDARAFIQDFALTLFDEGVAALVPVDTTLDPFRTGSFDIKTMRIASVVGWYPRHVRVRVWNIEKQERVEITLEKKFVAIVENPLYAVMNEENSTLRRLQRKLSLLDSVDEATSSGKLDLIIQLPYTVRSESRKLQAKQRRVEMEEQLKGSQYGIAYADATEKITQLNRPAENNLLKQVEYLTDKLYSELGLTPEVMNGTADEKTMNNYFKRTIKPVLDSAVLSMRSSFLTKTARSQGQSIMYFRDAFELTPMSEIAEIADKFARNEILSSNEIRQAIGFKPSKDPKADQLINSNMPVQDTGETVPQDGQEAADLTPIEDTLDSIISELEGSV